MHIVPAIGFLAGALTTVSFVPQVLKTWRSRSGGDLSLGMLCAFNAGVLLWLVYGLFLHSLPIIVANGVTLALALPLLAMKIVYSR